MKSKVTRILSLPTLKSEYAIVSMPQTAWYWLDDLVSKHYPDGYDGLVKKAFRGAGGPNALSAALEATAQEHCDRQMATLYHLANDNAPQGRQRLKTNPAHPEIGNMPLRLPSIYRLFHFMPHATYLTTVWERRNFHLNSQTTSF